MEAEKSHFFKRSLKQAKAYFNDTDKVATTLDKAFQKALYIDNEKGEVSGLIGKIKLFINMIRAYITGEYREVPWKTILLMFAGLIYFINPLDLISDFIPGIGYVDDVAVMLYIFKSVEEDIQNFQEFFYPENRMSEDK